VFSLTQCPWYLYKLLTVRCDLPIVPLLSCSGESRVKSTGLSRAKYVVSPTHSFEVATVCLSAPSSVSLCSSFYVFVHCLHHSLSSYCSLHLASPSLCPLRWLPRLARFTEVKARRPRLVLEWVTIRDDWALWTRVRSSVWTQICDWPLICLLLYWKGRKMNEWINPLYIPPSLRDNDYTHILFFLLSTWCFVHTQNRMCSS